MKRKFYPLSAAWTGLILCLFSIPASSQHINYQNDSGWKLGLNVGGTWQQSDMEKRAGIGFGATIGKALYQKEGRFFAFDLRFRYLRGWNYGFDTNRDTNLVATPVFNGSNNSNPTLNYYADSLGYIHRNYKMDLHEYTLEGVLTLNRLRERTGILLYGFGGIGLTNYRVRTNQINDATGQAYNYSTLDSGNVTVGGLETILDDTYETDALEISGTSSSRQLKFMPSAGIGIGYQFSPYFAMALEHKVTFALNDLIDGKPSSVNNHKFGTNDRYHYTALKFIWHLGKGGGSSTTHHHHTETTVTNINNYTTTNTTVTNNTNPVVVTKQKPIINITNPSFTPATSHSQLYTITANIYHVASSSDIIFKVNGTQVYGFTFNPSTTQFNSSITLMPGNNVVEIRASNKDGYDYQSVVINYDAPVVTGHAPIITYTNPSFHTWNTNNSWFNITATILNIQGAQNITYKVNGIVNSNYSFNPASQAFSSMISLNPGNNVVQITAVNNYGQDVEAVTIVYQAPLSSGLMPPVVTITNPTLNPYTVNVNSVSIDATVLNVASKNDISLKINGAYSSNFTYNTVSKHMNVVANLAEGANIFEITGMNAAGSDSKNTTIIYVKPVALPPLVTFTDPAVNPTTVSAAAKTIKANVYNVASQSDIQVTFNGANVTNFTYNLGTKELKYNATLINGANVMQITATNSAGSDTKSTTIIYQKINTNLPPVVTITYPSQNPLTTTNNTATIVASVLNVSGAGNITFTANGAPNTNFTYDATSKVFTANVTLNSGNNTFTITGTNMYGTDTKSTVIVYNPPCLQPVITMVQPASNTFTTANASENITAIISNVTQQSNIIFKVNGAVVPFNFNTTSGTLTATVNLNNGPNSVSITATNSCGNANSSSTITYNRPLVPPIVTITTPNVNPYITTVGTANIVATIQHVNTISGVSYKVNGSNNTNFVFNAANGTFSSSVTLVPGNNTIQVTGTNTDGTDSKSTVIVYNPVPAPCNNPVVIINNPASAVFTTNVSSLSLNGSVQNITSASELTLKVNGNNSTINYNAADKTFNAVITLQEGANTILVTAANACGTSPASATVTYVRPLTPPVVTILNPGQNPYNSAQQSVTLTANIINIQTASQITYTANGNTNTGFTFDPVSHTFSSNVFLSNGNNTFTISATNADGSDSKSTVIIYANLAPPCNTPVLTATHPATASETVNSKNYTITVNALNVSSANQLVLKQNGTVKPVSYSSLTKFATANVVLSEGPNSFELTATNECGNNAVSFTIVYARPLNPPVVTILNPAQNPHNTGNASFHLTATVTNVTAANGITFKYNGANSTNFTFNPSTGAFSSNLTLNAGNNTVEITGTNTDGSDFESTVIVYSPVVTPCKYPDITFITPPANEVITQGNFSVTAKITNVTNQANIVFKLNGVSKPFMFSNGNFQSNLSLTETANVFEITATNECGSVTEAVHATYNKPLPPPEVTITNPNPSPKTVTQPAFVFTAHVLGVTAASQVTFKFNNQVNNSFTFDPVSGNLSANLVLVTGNNTFQVTATNAAGTDSESATVTYSVPVVSCDNPTISINQPSANITVSQNTFTVKGIIKDVLNQSMVSFKQNGSNVAFTLSNAKPAAFTSNVTLAEGANNFLVTATNECGSTTVNFTITYNRPIQPPVVTITYPTTNPFTSVNPSANIGAKVEYVNSAADIVYKVNGVSMTNFAYNPNSDVFSGPATLVMGSNTIEIIATNADGSDNASTVIIYQPCTGSPSITLTSPAQINTTVTSDALTVTAQIANAFAQNEVTFKLNGASKTFTYNPNTGQFSGSVTLAAGNNTLEIYVNNNCGKADNIFNMTYTPPTNNNTQITICHYPPGNTGNPQTITIPQNAWPAHQAHGDTLGACPANKNKNIDVDPNLQKKLEEEKKRKEEEEAKRKAAEEEAKRKAAEEDAKRKAAEMEAAKKKAAEEAAKKKAAEEAAKKKAEEETKKKAEEEKKKIAPGGGNLNPNKGNNITVGEEGVD